MQIIGSIAGNIDRILLFHFLGGAALATYIFAINIPKQLRSLLTIFQPLVLPKMSVQNVETIKQTLPRKALILLLLIIGPVALYVVSAPYLYALFFPQYGESVIFSQVFALSLLFIPMSLLKNIFPAHQRKREMYIIRVTTSVVRIGFVVILLPLYGIWGAVAAILGTAIVNALLTLVLFFRIRPVTVNHSSER